MEKLYLSLSALSLSLSLTFACQPCNDILSSQSSAQEIFEIFVLDDSSLVDLNEDGRFEIFAANLKDIINHNLDYNQKYKRGIDRHSAMNFEEVKDYYNMDSVQILSQDCSATSEKETRLKDNDDIPDSWNWRENNGVSPVKDQRGCGSCWTFSTVGCLESAYLIKYNELVTFSEQQLVDCAGDFNNYGCNGGLPSQAFEYIHYAGGIATEESYPYFHETMNCTVNSDDYAVTVKSGSVNVTADNEDELKEAVYNYGPTSVCFQVYGDFSSYKSGVYSSSECQNTQDDVNHAVLAVGYGTENGTDYWLCKNSWGES